MKNKLGVLAWPAFLNKGDNPYNFLLYSNMQDDICILEFQFKWKDILASCFSSDYKIFHFHWPNFILSAESYFQALKRLVVFYLLLKIMRLSGKKIVWTVHNLSAHESIFPSLEKKLNAILYSNVDGFISLNKAGLEIIKNRAKNSKGKLFTHIEHPHYKNYYINQISKEEARIKLKIEKDKFVFLFFGQIRPYKNVISLVEAFIQLNEKDSILLIAGAVQKEIEEPLKCLVSGNDKIQLFNSFIKNEDIQYFLNAADLVVTPYKQIFNSGSLFLNLSFNRPTLAPDLLIFKELQKQVGQNWVRVYSGPISSKILSSNMHEKGNEDSSILDKKMNSYKPELIAKKTIEFYKSLI